MAGHRAVPVIGCGRREEVGALVIEGLKPEYEVVHFIMSVDDGKANLPLLLSGLPPGSSESQLGSREYTRPPQAVFFGGGYDENAVEQLRSTVSLTNGIRKVPWLRADMEKTAAGPTPGTKEYARSAALRIKTVLRMLAEDGKLDGNNDNVYFW